MSKIKILSQDIANKIAAGEVIERPSSVVKELVENSVDAGASSISVEINGKPWEYIKVQDDGEGMTEEDALLAFERHATSKISSLDDLFRISTLGFRGEALPSIASVSKLTLVTRTQDADRAFRVEAEGGTLISTGPVGAPVGTTVVVRELFYNTPARFKFLKKPPTEISWVYETLTYLALAHPGVAFRAYHDGRKVILTSGNGDALEAIRGIFGANFVQGLVKIAGGAEGVKVMGYIGRPTEFRADRSMEYILVNGRPVRSRAVISAVEKAYERLLPQGRYPVVFLWIKVPPDFVDVNIHPAKKEVKFADEAAVYRLVLSCVRQGLSSFRAMPHIKTNAAEESQVRPADRKAISRAEPNGKVTPAPISGLQLPGERAPERGAPAMPVEVPGAVDIIRETPASLASGTGGSLPQDLPDSEKDSEKDFEKGSEKAPEIRPLARFLSTYILAQSGEDLVIIDQHAAHERILYEKLLNSGASATNVPSQQLLIAPLLEFEPRMGVLISENLEAFARAGFELEPFGQNAFRLRSIPAALADIWDGELLSEFKAAITSSSEDAKPELKLGKLKEGLACKAAVKAGERLTDAGVLGLITELMKCDDPLTCPHGRPTMIRITRTYLERSFKRT